MSACDFVFHQPCSVDDAIGLLAADGDGARLLAGGQGLIPLLFTRRVRCRSLVDLSHVHELESVREGRGSLFIGAMCRQSTLQRRAGLADRHPLLASTLAQLGPAAVRSRATVVGNIASADPASELVAIAVAQGWRVEVRSASGSYAVLAEDFVTGPRRTALGCADLIAAIEVPPSACDGWALEETRTTSATRPVAGVCAGVRRDRDRITCARIVAFATGAPPARLRAVEAALIGERASDPVINRAATEAGCTADVREGGVPIAARRLMIDTLTRRALRTATGRSTMAQVAHHG